MHTVDTTGHDRDLVGDPGYEFNKDSPGVPIGRGPLPLRGNGGQKEPRPPASNRRTAPSPRLGLTTETAQRSTERAPVLSAARQPDRPAALSFSRQLRGC